LSLFVNRFVKVLGVTAIMVSTAFASTTERAGGLAPKISVAPKARIVAKIDNAKVTVQPGSHSLRLATLTDMGRAPQSAVYKGMKLVLKSSDEQEFALQTLLDQQQDKSHANYHQWLTPDSFGAKFGVHPADIAQVTSWLRSEGFTIDQVTKGSRIIQFTGTSGQVEKAFHTEMHNYLVDGAVRVANSKDISVPTALMPVVAGLTKLNNFPLKNDMKGVSAALKDGKVVSTTPIGGGPTTNFSFGNPSPYNELVGGSDLAVLYNTTPLLNAGYTGAGITIGIIGQTDVILSDIQTYRSVFGLPVNDPNIIQVSTDPNTIPDDGEADLDLELSGAMAPKATVDFYTANTFFEYGVDSASVYAVEQNVADVISLSYGNCESSVGTENAFYQALWEQAAAQGQSVFVSTGDDGPATCGTYDQYSVNGLGSTPWNVAVGGTEFNEGAAFNTQTTTTTGAAPYWGPTLSTTPYLNALRQIPDQPWNETQNEITAANFPLFNKAYILGGLTGGGSGVSFFWQQPNWQTGYGVPNSDEVALAQPSTGATPATVGVYFENGKVTAIKVTNGGAGYSSTTLPKVAIDPPVDVYGNPDGGVPATATATVTAGVITAITLTNPGSGYTAIPTVAIDAPATGGTQAVATSTATVTPFQNAGPHRYMPDVSLNAAVEHDGTAYCSEGSCQLIGNNLPTSNYCYGYNLPVNTLCNVGIVGGTSVASPSMAGAQALIDSYLASVNASVCKTAGLTTSQCGRQGNPNFYYYRVANAQSKTACISGAYTGTGVCGFHDSQQGNTNTPTTSRGTSTSPFFGWSTAPGYDLAVGLGSPDVAGLAYAWQSISFNATTTALNFNNTNNSSTNPVTGNHADEFTALISVYPVSGTGSPTGDVVLEAAAPGLLNFNYYGATNGVITLDSSSANGPGGGASVGMCIGGGLDNYFAGNCSYNYQSYSGMPGGTYNVYAHYAGDLTFGGSYSPSIAVNITPEPSSLLLTPFIYTAAGGVTANPAPTGTSSSLYTYGQGIYFDAVVCTAIGIADEAYGNNTCADGTPTGLITFTPSTGGTALPPLSVQLDTTDDAYLAAGPTIAVQTSATTFEYFYGNYPSSGAPSVLPPGAYTIAVSYAGDASFGAASATGAITIGATTPGVTLTAATADTSTSGPATFYVTVSNPAAVVGPPTNGLGAAPPVGTITVTDTTATKTLCTATITAAQLGLASCIAPAGSFTTAGAHAITATFAPGIGVGGSTYYATATSVAKTVTVITTTTPTVTLTQPTPIIFGAATAVVATVTSASLNPGGTVYLYDSISGLPVEIASGTLNNATSTTHTVTLKTTATTLLSVGTHILTANYGGSATLGSANTTASVTQVVTQSPTYLNLNSQFTGDIGYNTKTINGVTTVTGLAMQVQWNSTSFTNATTTLSNLATPTGTFSFYADYVSPTSPGTLLNPVAAKGLFQPGGGNTFMADATTTLLTPGPHTLTATFSGDKNYIASVSDTLPVNVGLTTLALSASATNIGTGEPIKLTATILPVTPTVSKIGGTVTFTDTFTPAAGGAATTTTLVPYPAAAPVVSAIVPVNGTLTTAGTATATLTTTLSGVGTHVITATYSGDSRFYTSAGTFGTAITAVTPAFSLQIVPTSPTSLTIARGSSGSFPIQATVTGNWTGTAPLVCVGLPANSYCTFTFPSSYVPPAYFTFNGADATFGPVTVTITTFLPHTTTGVKSSAFLWFPALLMAGLLGLRRKQLTPRQRQLMLMAILLCGSLATTACSTLSMQTNPGSYTVQVQANGVGSTSASPNIQPVLVTPLTLTIQ
jgi:hypothetical protein